MNRFFRYRLDHVLFWVLTVGFHAFSTWTNNYTNSIEFYISEIIVRNLLLAILIYSNLFLIFPLFTSNKIGRGVVLVILTLIAYAALKSLYSFVQLDFMEMIRSEMKDRAKDYLPTYVLQYGIYYNFSIGVFYLGFATAIQLSKQWYLQREMLRKIQLEKLNTELDYLKAQMNPHFLFNSINTIFFQINKENTEARETLGKFSDMLRYQLYECNADTIAIEKEVEYLRNYVALQQLRKDEHYAITFQVDSMLRGFEIPPLLLIPFIENAFKHVSNHSDKPNTIEIALRKHGEIMELQVINTTDRNESPEPGGIGLKNVKRRLELLYPDRHWLTVDTTHDQYTVTLKFRIT